MSEILNDYLSDIMSIVFELLSEKELNVLLLRNGGFGDAPRTLEEISHIIGSVTRERIRQIESKAIEKINKNNKGFEICLKFGMFYEKCVTCINRYCDMENSVFLAKTYVTFEECYQLCDKDLFLKALAIYKAVSNNRFRVQISEKYEFIFNSLATSEKDVSFMILGIDSDVIKKTEIINLAPISKKILLDNYHITKGVYIRNGVMKREIILSIIDEYFPKGIRPTREQDYENFKKYYIDVVGSNYEFNVREIVTAITNSGDYCFVNNGTYLRYDKCNKISQDLLDKIIDYALRDGGTIYYSTIYNIFKKQLNEQGIDNWYYFKGVFDRETDGMFYGRKATFSVNSKKQFEDPIYDYIADSNSIITIQELRNKFPGLKDYMFFFRIYAHQDVLSLENLRFVSAKNIELSSSDIDTIRVFIEDCISKSDFGIVSSRVLYPLLKIKNSELLNRIGCFNEQFGFYSLCNYLFYDNFSFSRPFISKKGITDITLNKILEKYIDEKKLAKFDFNQLDQFAYKYNTFLNAKISFIEEFAYKYLLVSDTEFMNLNFRTIENNAEIRNRIIFTFKQIKQIKINDFNNYNILPFAKPIKRNKLTLFSYINAFCLDELEVELLNNSIEDIDYMIRSLD